jgi:hypothetical protein
MDPDAWRAVNDWGLQLLVLPNLARYRHLLPPMEEDLQDEWEAAMTHPGKYVNLLVGQRNDEDRRGRDKLIGIGRNLVGKVLRDCNSIVCNSVELQFHSLRFRGIAILGSRKNCNSRYPKVL